MVSQLGFDVISQLVGIHWTIEEPCAKHLLLGFDIRLLVWLKEWVACCILDTTEIHKEAVGQWEALLVRVGDVAECLSRIMSKIVIGPVNKNMDGSIVIR